MLHDCRAVVNNEEGTAKAPGETLGNAELLGPFEKGAFKPVGGAAT
jgi:hypothetical protein